jgi:hypothetical protein
MWRCVVTAPSFKFIGNVLLFAILAGLVANPGIVRAVPAPGPSANDPCSLLTQTEVSTVLGVQMGAGKVVGATACEWSAATSNATSTKKVAVTLITAQGYAMAKLPVNSNSITKAPVNGVGDEAIQGTTGKFATTLSVKKGDTYFVVNVRGFPLNPGADLDKVQTMEKTLAMAVLGNL